MKIKILSQMYHKILIYSFTYSFYSLSYDRSIAFQSEFSTKSDLMLRLSIYGILSFP
jgi:hypothetical protein